MLDPSLVVSYAHADEDIDRTVAAIDAALQVYRRALDAGRRALSGRQTLGRRVPAIQSLRGAGGGPRGRAAGDGAVIAIMASGAQLHRVPILAAPAWD